MSTHLIRMGSCEKRKYGHRHTEGTQCEDIGKRPALQAKERGLEHFLPSVTAEGTNIANT